MTSGAEPSLRLRARTAGTVTVSAISASLPSSASWLPAASVELLNYSDRSVSRT